MMNAVRQPESPLTSGNTNAHEDDTNIEVSRNTGPGIRNEKLNEADGLPESDLSDHEASKEFKEGGYGWYVVAKGERMVMDSTTQQIC